MSAVARDLVISNDIEPKTAIAMALDQAFEQKRIEPGEVLEGELYKSLSNELTGLGVLQPFLDDDEVEEVWVNSPNEIYVARGGVNFFTGVATTESEIRSIVDRMLRASGRRIDRSTPFVDASLPDGSRLHVAIPDATKTHWSLNVRKFPKKVFTLADLVDSGTLTGSQAQTLLQAVHSRRNILVSGATQAGKTTLLCALLEALSGVERLVTVEETFEIRTSAADWVALQTRQDNVEGFGAITLRRLIKEALRMRPSRLVVGEVREAESLDLLIALNSGIPGMCTIHANSASDAISKLCTLPLLAGQNIPSEFIRPTVAQVIDLVVHCELDQSGRRRVSEICKVVFDRQSQSAMAVAF